MEYFGRTPVASVLLVSSADLHDRCIGRKLIVRYVLGFAGSLGVVFHDFVQNTLTCAAHAANVLREEWEMK